MDNAYLDVLLKDCPLIIFKYSRKDFKYKSINLKMYQNNIQCTSISWEYLLFGNFSTEFY